MKSYPAKKHGQKSNSRKLLAATLSVLAVTALLTTAIILLRSPAQAPDPTVMEKTEAVKFIASDKFAALPEQQKIEYVRKMRGDNPGPPPVMDESLSDAERQAVRKNMGSVMRKEMVERTRQFFKMSKEEQEKFLDKMIADMEARRKNDQAQGRTPGGPGGLDGGNRDARMQAMLEGTDSTTRAQMHEMHERIRQRMQQQNR